jgi:peroxiredoxin
LQSRLADIRATGTEVLAVSVDPPEKNAELAAKIGVEYPLLADPTLQTVDAFHLRHQNGGPGGTMGPDDISRPATYLIGPEGQVLWEDFTDNYRIRIRPQRVLDVLQRFR